MTQCVIYARFSPRPDADQSTSIETQIDACTRYAETNSLTVLSAFSDREMSGADPERPGLWAAIEAVPPGGTLLVYRLDRLSRDVYLSHIIERRLGQKGARVVSTQGEGTASDSPHDELVRGILRLLAQYERKTTAARTKAAMLYQQNVLKRPMGAHAPYGQRIVDGALVPDEAEQEVIAKVMGWHENLSPTTIAKTLEREGYPSRGQRWHANTVKRIVKQNLKSHSQSGVPAVH